MNGVPWWFFDGLPGPCAGLQLRSLDPGGQLRTLLPTAQVIGGADARLPLASPSSRAPKTAMR